MRTTRPPAPRPRSGSATGTARSARPSPHGRPEHHCSGGPHGALTAAGAKRPKQPQRGHQRGSAGGGGGARGPAGGGGHTGGGGAGGAKRGGSHSTRSARR